MKTWVIVVAALLLTIGAQEADSAEHVYLEGDLHLEGNETRILANAIFHLDGEVRLEGASTLIVDDAVLVLSKVSPDIWASHATMRIIENARLRIIDSTVKQARTSQLPPHVFVLVGQCGSVELSHVTIESGHIHVYDNGLFVASASRVLALGLWDGASATLTSTNVEWAVSMNYAGDAKVRVLNLHPGYIEEWQSPRTDDCCAPQATIEQSTIGAWSIGADDRVVLEIEDSAIDRLELRFACPTGPIRDLGPGQFDEWSLRGQSAPEAAMEVVLRNTSITSHVNVKIRDGQGDVHILSSSVFDISVENYIGNLTVESASVSAFQMRNSSVNLALPDSTLSRGIDMVRSSLYMGGICDIAENAAVSEWEESGCTRGFVIVVRRSDGSSVVGAIGQLLDSQSAAPLFQTNSDGVAHTWVSFGDSTAHLGRPIRVTDSIGNSVEIMLRPLSASPVVVILDGD